MKRLRIMISTSKEKEAPKKGGLLKIMKWVLLVSIMMALMALPLTTASCETLTLEQLWEQAKMKEWSMESDEPITVSHANSIFEICQSWTNHLGDWTPSDSSFVRMTRIMSKNTVTAADLVYHTLRNNSMTWGDLYPLVESTKDAFDMKELAQQMQALKESVAEPGTPEDPWYNTPTFSTVYEKWEMSYLTLGSDLPMEGWPENQNPVMSGVFMIKKGAAEFFVVKLTPRPSNQSGMHDVSYTLFDLLKTDETLWKLQNGLMRPLSTLDFEVCFGMYYGALNFRGLYGLKAVHYPPYKNKN